MDPTQPSARHRWCNPMCYKDVSAQPTLYQRA